MVFRRQCWCTKVFAPDHWSGEGHLYLSNMLRDVIEQSTATRTNIMNIT